MLQLTPGGSRDPSFKAEPVDFAGSDDTVHAIGIDSEGRAVVAGTVYADGGVGAGLARFVATGDRDSTFGVDGRASARLPVSGGVSMVLAHDGSAAIGYAVLAPSGPKGFGLSRFNRSGQLDLSSATEAPPSLAPEIETSTPMTWPRRPPGTGWRVVP